MPHKLTCALLTAAITLAAASTAHAKWITGNNNPPIFTDTQPCRNGIAWSYAAVHWPQPQQHVLFAHSLSTDVGLSPTTPPTQAQTVAFSLFRPIPRQIRVITDVLTANQFLPGPPDVFNFSGDFYIPFNAPLNPGTQLRMRWQEPDGTWIAARYTVRSCWYMTPIEDERPQLRPVLE